MLSQQSGVFGRASATEIAGLLRAIPTHYRSVYLKLNAENFRALSPRADLSKKTNLILPLQEDYALISAAYGKSLRKRLRKASAQLEFKSGGKVGELIAIYREQIGGRLGWPAANYRMATALIEAAMERNKGFIARVYNTEGVTEASGFFLHSHGRIINVLGASTPAGKQHFAMHFLLDRVIHQHQFNADFFDFEGSEIPGVAAFFRSFGAQEELYGEFQRRDLPRWLHRLLAYR